MPRQQVPQIWVPVQGGRWRNRRGPRGCSLTPGGHSGAWPIGLAVVVTEVQGSWRCCSPGRGHQQVRGLHSHGQQGSVGHGCGCADLALVTALPRRRQGTLVVPSPRMLLWGLQRPAPSPIPQAIRLGNARILFDFCTAEHSGDVDCERRSGLCLHRAVMGGRVSCTDPL